MTDRERDPRLESLELGHQQMIETTRQIQETLKILMSRQPPIKNEPSDEVVDVAVDAAPIRTASTAKRPKIKPSQPTEFDGNRSKGRAFITTVMLYVSLCPHEFTGDQQRIHWVLTFMKKDRAALFAERTMRMEARNKCPRFADWQEFIDTFISLFCPANEATDALVRLETMEYHQKKRDVDEYVDEFADLIDKSGYTDPLVIVVKFRRGLNPAIRTKIAELGINRPKDDDPEKWFEMARMLDLNRISSEAFESTYNRPQGTSTATSTSRSIFPRVLGSQTSQHMPSVSQNRLTTSTRQETPSQRLTNTPRACFRCGSLDHLSPQCKQKFDVRAMTSDEKEDLLEQLLADKDVAKEEVEEVRRCEEEVEAPTDFVQCSR